MTDEELENEAEEYALGMMGNKYNEFCKLEQTYIDARKKGYEEGKKEILDKLENGIIRITDSKDSQETQETNEFDRVKYLEKLLSISEEINEDLKTKIKEQVELIETQYVENQTLGNNNAKLLRMYGECRKENAELKAKIESMTSVLKEIADYSDCKASENMAKKELKKWELAE